MQTHKYLLKEANHQTATHNDGEKGNQVGINQIEILQQILFIITAVSSIQITNIMLIFN